MLLNMSGSKASRAAPAFSSPVSATASASLLYVASCARPRSCRGPVLPACSPCVRACRQSFRRPGRMRSRQLGDPPHDLVRYDGCRPGHVRADTALLICRLRADGASLTERVFRRGVGRDPVIPGPPPSRSKRRLAAHEADNIGMLGTVMNALMLRGALTARTVTDVRVMTAMPIQSVAEPFIRLRAVRHLEHGLIVLLAGGIGQPYVTTDYPAVQRTLELDADALLMAKHGVDGVYDSDPNLNPAAVRYERLTYEEALAAGVRVMDTSAFVLANEQGLDMHVFDVAAVGAMRQICLGTDLGTRISAKA